ncbi:MAG TPA: TraR/DksA C4-type zinc finger protein [bacterium]|nr:TraR/DksA C4-type zinc finger protein [bacterium]HPN81434.1 TraR/DksA C4-type zinc finger protein [bacterium]HPW39574.1 TraR/DksA C4-type zinc finger protein [bacterium]
MEEKIIQELKQQLEEKKNKIIANLESVGKRADGEEINFNAEFPNYGDSTEDNAVEVADYTKNLSFERKLEDDLRDVDRALERIASGDYGKCRYCGQEIEIERLKVRPESTACVACKQALKGEE